MSTSKNTFALRCWKSGRALVLAGAAIVMPFVFGSQAQAQPLCNGILTYDHMEGVNTVYRGTGTGYAWVIDTDGHGKVETKIQLPIVPGHYYVLKPDQGWNCGS